MIGLVKVLIAAVLVVVLELDALEDEDRVVDDDDRLVEREIMVPRVVVDDDDNDRLVEREAVVTRVVVESVVVDLVVEAVEDMEQLPGRHCEYHGFENMQQ